MQDFIDLSAWSGEALRQLIELAIHLKTEWQAGGNRPVLHGKVLAMVFQKPSLRTRVSFEVGMLHLGGHAIMLGPNEIGLGQRESIADVARVLSGYAQGIMARVFDHTHVTELAAHATVPVINGLSDDQHPCQAMSDMLTIYEHFGRLDGLRIAYIGDGNNMAVSLAQAAMHFGAQFALAAPEVYQLPAQAVAAAVALANSTGVTLEQHIDPEAAVRGADVIYTDTWVSMGQEGESAARLAALRPYQVNERLISQARRHAIVMHCLPAHRGQEITDGVADGPQSVIFQQAANRLHLQKAILVQLMR
ncbi:MAG: ornithine carbamoyltransferase [Chloroflexi bacterium]|nr:ornithine carbamoyltransferase [Chloroflexota bacterium]